MSYPVFKGSYGTVFGPGYINPYGFGSPPPQAPPDPATAEGSLTFADAGPDHDDKFLGELMAIMPKRLLMKLYKLLHQGHNYRIQSIDSEIAREVKQWQKDHKGS